MSPAGRVTSGELVGLVARRTAEIESELKEIDALRSRHGAEQGRLKAQLADVEKAITTALLPDLSPPSVERAVALTGFFALAQKDPRAAVAEERLRIQARVAAIEAEPRYRDRELLRAPRVGQLWRAIAELEEFRAPSADVVERAKNPRLERLIESGYDTDAYSTGFWRLSYYRDWEAGDAILERFPGKKRFAEVREEYLAARDSLAVYDGKLAALRAEVAAGERLDAERASALESLATVEARHLEAARRRIGQHVVELVAPEALAGRLEGEPDLLLALKQAHGLRRKIEYLDGIADSEIGRQATALRQERARLERDRAKYSRPKHAGTTFDRGEIDRRFRERPDKLRRRWQRTTETYNPVYVFDRYDRGSFARDFLWWDLMTDGRADGDFLPEVVAFRREHPEYRYARDHDAGDAESRAAAAVAAGDRGRFGDELLADVS